MDKRLKRIFTVPDAFIAKLDPIQRKVFDDLFKRLNKLEVVDGNIVKSKKNFRIIDQLTTEIHDFLLSTDYTKDVKTFVAEFDTQKQLNDSYYKSKFNSEFSTVLADVQVSNIKKAVVEALITDSVKSGFLTPLESVLQTAVSTGSGFTETIQYIRNFVEGNEDVDGAILKYTKQLAHDSFANADRGYNSAIADELDLDWFLWAGGEIATSRCFCIERHGKYYHYKEIEAWGRGEDIGECKVDNGWAGMNRATNEKTIFNYAGGYGCMHTVAGVSVFDVPKEDIERNLANGNYSPTPVEAEFFGL